MSKWELFSALGCVSCLHTGVGRASNQKRAGGGEGIDRECPAEPTGASPASFAPFQNVRERATAHSGAKTHGMLLKRRLWLLSES